ncbi:TRAP transporter small permease [Microbulbifer sp. S227A]|uniref:TRAP transporter small permease n=1 Tax=Microbulbifer sp. S227A TaxID=3415131 RepID=UPI003C7C7BB3
MRIVAAIETAMAWLAAGLLTLTGVLLTYEVVARYFFNAPTIWAAELSQLCLIWACPVAMGWALSHGRHIRVTALTAQMPRPWQRTAEVISLLVILCFSVVVLIYGYDIFLDSFERGRTTGTMLDLPAWLPEASVPAGFLLLILSCLTCLWRILRGNDTAQTEETQ